MSENLWKKNLLLIPRKKSPVARNQQKNILKMMCEQIHTHTQTLLAGEPKKAIPQPFLVQAEPPKNDRGKERGGGARKWDARKRQE